MHLNAVNSNTEGIFTTDFRIAQLGSIGKFSFLPTIIMPLSTGRDSIYKVRTLLDSGAGHSWIANGLLKHVNYTRMPAQRLTIATLNGSVKRRCQMVQVYFLNKVFIPIECFVLVRRFCRAHCSVWPKAIFNKRNSADRSDNTEYCRPS